MNNKEFAHKRDNESISMQAKKSLDNNQFVTLLSQKTGYSLAGTQQLTDILTRIITDNLINGNVITIDNFGTFEVNKEIEHIIFDPKTQKRMLVPPQLVLTFKSEEGWEEQLNEREERQ